MAASLYLYRKTFDLLNVLRQDPSRFEEYIKNPANGKSLYEIRNELVRLSTVNNKPDIYEGVELGNEVDLKQFEGLCQKFSAEFFQSFEQAYWTGQWEQVDPTFEEAQKEENTQTQVPSEQPEPKENTDSPSLDMDKNTGGQGMDFGSSNYPRQSFARRDYPFRSGKEGGSGEGTAATNKTANFNKPKILGPDGEPIGGAGKRELLGTDGRPLGRIKGELLGRDGKPISSARGSRLVDTHGNPLGKPVARYIPGIGRRFEGPAKNFGSRFGIGARKAITRTPSFLRSFLPEGLSGALGLGGGSRVSGLFNSFARGQGGIRFLRGGRIFGLGGAGSSGISGGAGGLGGAAGSVARGGAALASSPWFWIILILILLFLGILFIKGPDDEILTVKVDKIGPTEVDNGQLINYSISVTNLASSSAEIQVTDTLPAQVEFVEADPKPDNQSGNRLVWLLKNIGVKQIGTITLTVRPKENDIWVQNKVEAIPILKAQQIPSGGGDPPNQNNCSGRYSLNNPIGNFGDPSCSFSKDFLYELLKQHDPANADYWFTQVVRCESGYNPNSFADPIAVGTPDSAGAWGLYQMGRGKNGQYDRGDVAWQLQTTNAIAYNNLLPFPWRYWQCAKDRW